MIEITRIATTAALMTIVVYPFGPDIHLPFALPFGIGNTIPMVIAKFDVALLYVLGVTSVGVAPTKPLGELLGDDDVHANVATATKKEAIGVELIRAGTPPARSPPARLPRRRSTSRATP